MNDHSFLTFTVQGMLLGIDTKTVREIVWLPELTLIEECSPYIAGIINMHGKIVPVMDLIIRFGHAAQRYTPFDRVIILSVSEFNSNVPEQNSLPSIISSSIELIGIIANEVLDVIDIPDKNIEPSLFVSDRTDLKSHPHFVRGEAKAGEDIIMILDPGTFFEKESAAEETEIEKHEIISETAALYFCPEADVDERRIFHDRAINLQQISDGEDSEKAIPAAVISLNNEYLCVELDAVREFSKIRNFTPVPCCPEHIAGNMNLRGNVLTVIDISGILNLQAGSISESTKVIVAETGGFPVGIIADEVLDVLYLRETDIVPVPSSMMAKNEKFVKGAAPYGSRMMAILNLKEILSWEGLIVNEEV